MDWMLMPYRRYFDFSGRSRRKEYWMFTLLVVLVYILCFALIAAGGGLSMSPTGGTQLGGMGMLGAIVLGIFVLGSIIPMLAVQVRRFHDQDKSGWFVLLGFIPYIGGLVVLVFMCLDGTKGPNRFGDDPKDPTSSSVFS